jgi:TRAP-type C4-dicarboxylate transport system permease small subunit
MNPQQRYTMGVRVIGAAMVVAGAVLGWFGWQEYNSFSSSISSALSGSPTDRAMWMLGGAAVLLLLGLGLALRGGGR